MSPSYTNESTNLTWLTSMYSSTTIITQTQLNSTLTPNCLSAQKNKNKNKNPPKTVLATRVGYDSKFLLFDGFG